MKVYGPEPEWKTTYFDGGGYIIQAICTAPDHSHVPPGGQCRCGVLNVGQALELADEANPVRVFFEEFEPTPELGCDLIIFTDEEIP